MQKRLGHSQISVTIDTYSRVQQGMVRAAASRLDRLIVSATATAGQTNPVAAATAWPWLYRGGTKVARKVVIG